MKNLMNKLTNGLSTISIIAWVITIMMIACALVVGLNDVAFRLAWNEISRYYSTDYIVNALMQVIAVLAVIAGATNLLEKLLNRIIDSNYDDEEDFDEEIEEVFETEAKES